MKSSKLFITLILCFITYSNVVAQDFLNTYFKGNKDSLIVNATKLINMPEPTFEAYKPTYKDSLKFVAKNKKKYQTGNRYFTVRDNHKIFAYRFKKKSPNTIILIHGVKSTGENYLEMTSMLQVATKAEVYAIDLRGHGKSDGQSGDVDYINQYTDDLEDIIRIIRTEKPNGKVIIAGHSMGGGISLLFANKNQTTNVDGFLLFAPLIGHNSPAFPKQAPKKNDKVNKEEFMKINIPRIIGLKMMNEINKHEQDNLPVLHFNLPIGTPLRQYTYRANMSMAPENYIDGLKSVKAPLLVLIGDKDEAFVAEEQRLAVIKNSTGEVRIIENETHQGICNNKNAFEEVKKWFNKL